MKRFFYLAALLALVASPAVAKTCICHVEGTDEAHLVLVADSSVPAHLEQHGDCIADLTACDSEDDACVAIADDDGLCVE